MRERGRGGGERGIKEIYNQERVTYGRMTSNAEFFTFKTAKYESNSMNFSNKHETTHKHANSA
jgi:hypothetical protein